MPGPRAGNFWSYDRPASLGQDGVPHPRTGGRRRTCARERGGLREGHAPTRQHLGSDVGLTAEVVEDHVRTHLVDAELHPGALTADAVEQLLDVVCTYSK